MSLITSSKNCPLLRMSWAYSLYLGAPSGPNICSDMISEKPMMALSGVRNSWLILARNSDLERLASSARLRSAAYLSASSAKRCDCSSAIWRSFCKSRTVLISVRSDCKRFTSCCFNAVMSVPTETKPPSLVRRSFICSQRPSANCTSSERAPDGEVFPSLAKCCTKGCLAEALTTV